MRRLHKYQIYKKTHPISKLPLRLFKFKRPKWTKSFSFWKKKIKFNYFYNLYYKDRFKEVSTFKRKYKVPYLKKQKKFRYPLLRNYVFNNTSKCIHYRRKYYLKRLRRISKLKTTVARLKLLVTRVTKKKLSRKRFFRAVRRFKRRLSIYWYNYLPAPLAKKVHRAQNKRYSRNNKFNKFNKFKHNFNLIDITTMNIGSRFWNKVKSCYKNRLNSYTFLLSLFDNSVKSKFLKQNAGLTNRKDFYLKYYFRNYYNPYTLVWLSSFLASSFEARQKGSSEIVLVNNKVGSNVSLLQKGDIVSILDKKVNVLNIMRKYNRSFSFLSHVEIDYYSQNIAVIKDISTLSKDDYLLLVHDYINSHKIK